MSAGREIDGRNELGSISDEERRRRRREGALILAAGFAVLLFAIWEIRDPRSSEAAGNVFSFLLINTNIILLLLLVFLVVRNLLKLMIERRRKVLGSQLKGRLVMSFITIALFPCAVLLLVSMEFFTNTIDTWFSTEVEKSLQGAWELAHTYYEESAEDALRHSRAVGQQIAQVIPEGGEVGAATIERVVKQNQEAYGLGTVQVFDARRRQVGAFFNPAAPTGVPMQTDNDLLEPTLAGNETTRVESLGESDVIRGASPIRDENGTILGAVVVDYVVGRSARAWSEDILTSYRDYRELKLNKGPFKNLYVITLSLASLVVVFSATWVGIYLARSITDPIGRLAEATREVAAGRWDVRINEGGGDEVGTLVRAFNSMTEQLKGSHEDLDERRRYIENVLAHVAAGVVSVDNSGVINTVNPVVISLLGIKNRGVVGKQAGEVFEAAGYPEVVAILEELRNGRIASGARRNIARENEGRTLLCTVTTLVRRSGERAGAALFFEDVSQIAEIERTEAWKEVARRIAHEIKNPLTPIQLSAQRLRRRLGKKLSGADAEIFEECTTTIDQQVDELKTLVNEFSRFSHRAAATMHPHSLGDIVTETLPLYRQSRPDIAFRSETADALPDVSMNRDAVKRALINLLDNAVAAIGNERNEIKRVAAEDGEGSQAGKTPPAEIIVVTRYDKGLSRVVLEVADSGPGIPPEHRARVFEPYFSTKPEGTGLGLAIVASVASDHRAYIRLKENQPRGSRFIIEFPVKPEASLESETATS